MHDDGLERSPTRPRRGFGGLVVARHDVARRRVEADAEARDRDRPRGCRGRRCRVPVAVVHLVGLEPVGELARARRAVVVPRRPSVSATMLSSMSQPLPLASTAESALFLPDAPDPPEGVAAQRPRVGAFLQVGALGGDVLEHVVLDQHPLGVVALARALDARRCTRTSTSWSWPSRRRRPRRTAGCCGRCRG